MNDVIRKHLTGRNWTLPDAEWYSKIRLWLAWYQNFVKDFHNYKVYNGVRFVGVERFRLGMAKTCCEDHANLLLNEKVQITAASFPALDDVLTANNFRERANRLVEVAYALGSGAIVEYRGADGQPVIDYIRADMIFPLSWGNLVITECAFASQKIIDKAIRYYLQIHTLDGDQYMIENVYLDESGKVVSPPTGVEPIVRTGSTKPLFQIIKPNVVNNLDLDNPMGISVYGNALSQLKALDLVYDSYVNEFHLGRKRIMIPQSMATIEMQQDGTVQSRFDPNDTVFYTYEQNKDGQNEIKDIDMELRAEPHDLGLQKQLDLFSKKVGLGTGYYKFEAGVVRTAKEVVSTNSDLYKNRKKNEIPLEEALTSMVRALSFLSGGSPDVDVSIDFDDSIIEDTDAVVQKNVLLLNNGLRSKVEAIMEIEKCNKEEAEKKLAEINKESAVSIEGVEAFAAAGESGDE